MSKTKSFNKNEYLHSVFFLFQIIFASYFFHLDLYVLLTYYLCYLELSVTLAYYYCVLLGIYHISDKKICSFLMQKVKCIFLKKFHFLSKVFIIFSALL